MTALRVYRSTDGQNWSLQGTLTWQKDHDGYATSAEPYYLRWVKDGKAKVQYSEPTGEDKVYFTIEAVSLISTVVSQSYCFTPPVGLPLSTATTARFWAEPSLAARWSFWG